MHLYGRAHHGKTECLRELQKRYPRGEFKGGYEQRPVVYLQAESGDRPEDLYKRLLEELNLMLAATTKDEVRKQLMVLVPAMGVRVLAVDEMQDLDAGEGSRFKPVINHLKARSNDLGLVVVTAGVEGSSDVVRNSDQLKSRFKEFKLPTWQVRKLSDETKKKMPEKELEEIKGEIRGYRLWLRGMESHMPLPEASKLEDLWESIIFLAEFMSQNSSKTPKEFKEKPKRGAPIGYVRDLIVGACVLAMEQDCSKIIPDHLETVASKW